jgi:tetratricopeptide (TPR) repeat protein
MRVIFLKHLRTARPACSIRTMTTPTHSLKRSETELARIRAMVNRLREEAMTKPAPSSVQSRNEAVMKLLDFSIIESPSQVPSASSDRAPVQVSSDERVLEVLRLFLRKSRSKVSSSATSDAAPIHAMFPPHETFDGLTQYNSVRESLDSICTAKDSSKALSEFAFLNRSQKRAALHSLSSNNFMWMLQQIWSAHGGDVATALVSKMIQKTIKRPADRYLLHSAIVVMLKNNDMDGAFRLWNLLDTYATPAQPWLYSLAIKQFVGIGKVDQALHMYTVMKELSDAPIEKSAGLLLRAMLRERVYGDIEQIADDLCDVLKEPADPRLLELLLNAYSKAGNITRMQDMCSYLVDQDIQPRAPIISIMVSAYLKSGMRDEALDMVDLLLQTYDKMDDKMQRILISTILRASGPKDAMHLLELLDSHNMLRSCRCHIMLSSAYAHAQQHEKVAELFERAEEINLEITPPFFTLAINSALKLNNLSRAKILLSRCEAFLKKGEMRRETFYTLQLNLHSREGRHDKVKHLWDTELKQSASRSVALSLYIDSAGHNCNASTVVDLWKSLEADGYDLNNENLINSFLEALLRTGHHDLALQAFKREFQKRSIIPTTKTLITVLQPLVMKQNIAVIRKLKDYIFHTYPTVIPAWQSVQEMLEGQLKKASSSNNNTKNSRKGHGT